MSDHAWKNAFGAELNGSMNLATNDAAGGTGSVFGSNALVFGQDSDTVTISSSDGGTFGDISVDTGNDFNFFFADQPVADGSGGLFSELFSGLSSPFSFQDNDTVTISSSDGGTFGDISVDTGNDFNFFFADQPVADGSGGLFSELFSGLSSLFSFQDNDTVTISSSDGGTFGDISVDTGNDFNFFFADQPVADGSGGLFSELFSGLSSLFSFQDNDTVTISSSDGGTFGDISVDTGNDFNFFFGSSPLFSTEVA